MTLFARRPWLAALIASALVVLLVLAAIGLGLRIPGLGFLDGPLDRTRLDYQSRFVGGYAPLRDGFVDARLGGPTSPGGSPRGSRLGAGAAAAADPSSAPPPLSIQHEATNDDFENAYEVPSIPVSARTTTSNATRQSGEPGDCSIVGGTVWYRYTPLRDTRLVADTFGTRYSNALAVFRGAALADLRQVACDKGATGNAQVSYVAPAGVPHYFQVTGVAGGGLLTFNLQPLGVTQRIDGRPTSDAVQSPTDFGAPAVSENGKYVAFSIQGSPCATDETCIFVRDVEVGRTTQLLSTDSGATNPTDNFISDIDISGDGRTIAFSSAAANFVPDGKDTNRLYDVFVIDRLSRRIERVSVTSRGNEAQTPPTGSHRSTFPLTYSGSMFPSVSSDGRFVSFVSDADNLDPRARSGYYSTYVHDRRTGRTELASVDSAGEPILEAASRYGNAISGDGQRVVFSNGNVFVRDRQLRTTTDLGPGNHPVISNDGRRVAFVRTYGNGLREVFVHDLVSRKSTSASVSSEGTRHLSPSGRASGPGTSTFPRVGLSADGRYVTFESAAPGLAPKDTNGPAADVFVHDLTNRTTTLVSIRSDGSNFSEDSYYPSISGDGRIVAFQNDTSERQVFAHISAVAGRP